MTDIIDEINSMSLFSQEEKDNFISKIRSVENKGKVQNYVECIVRKKEILLTPEEAVRQLYIARLNQQYGYPISRIKLEYPVHFGREVKRADIVIFEEERPTTAYIVIELKKNKLKDGKEQLKSYCNSTGSSIAIWTNGSQIAYYNRKDPNYFEEITEIPTTSQTLKDILDERFTLKDLILKDKILKDGKTLKQIILDMEDEVTPRHVIDMCVKMLNPKAGEHMIDTASGSCGFPVHTIFKITGKLFSNVDIPEEEKDNVLKIFGIDFDEKVVRVSRTLNLIAGDGNTNVLHLNTLDYDRWSENTKSLEWNKVYGDGFDRLKELQVSKNSYKEFKFELLMANPPFAGDIKETRILSKYDLAFSEDQKGNKKSKNKVGRDILFIERNLDFVRPGGRLAIVLPQGRFNNSSDKDIREYIADKARILAVVGLDVNTFKPHTGTKTSVIFLQKWNDDNSDSKYYCPHKADYPIFFAVSEKSGKDNSGEYVYLKDTTGKKITDKYGHFIVEHDLHNQEGKLPNGIAEAFIEFAKSENLSFWSE